MTADKESISLQVQALPYTTLSYILSLPTFFQTSTLTFLKFCVLQVSLCAVQVLQCMSKVCPSCPCSGVTNIPVCVQPCSGASSAHRASEGVPCSAARREGLPGTSCPQLLLQVPAGEHQMDGGPACLHPHHLLPSSFLFAQREQLQGTVLSILLRCPE